jgi:hypothetical protein
MKKAALFISAILISGSPAYAQIRLNSPGRDPNPTMVRTPPSSLPGAGLSGPGTSSTTSTYPAPIRHDYNPTFFDPTDRNSNLRQR